MRFLRPEGRDKVQDLGAPQLSRTHGEMLSATALRLMADVDEFDFSVRQQAIALESDVAALRICVAVQVFPGAYECPLSRFGYNYYFEVLAACKVKRTTWFVTACLASMPPSKTKVSSNAISPRKSMPASGAD